MRLIYLRACLGARLLPLTNLSEGADRVGGQLHGDKECPFSGVTKSGRVWRKVPESDAGSLSLSVGQKVAMGQVAAAATFTVRLCSLYFCFLQSSVVHLPPYIPPSPDPCTQPSPCAHTHPTLAPPFASTIAFCVHA